MDLYTQKKYIYHYISGRVATLKKLKYKRDLICLLSLLIIRFEDLMWKSSYSHNK